MLLSLITQPTFWTITKCIRLFLCQNFEPRTVKHLWAISLKQITWERRFYLTNSLRDIISFPIFRISSYYIRASLYLFRSICTYIRLCSKLKILPWRLIVTDESYKEDLPLPESRINSTPWNVQSVTSNRYRACMYIFHRRQASAYFHSRRFAGFGNVRSRSSRLLSLRWIRTAVSISSQAVRK